MSKHAQFAPLAPSFVGRRGLLVEHGPTVIGCKVVDVTCDAKGMQARILLDDGRDTKLSSPWEHFIFDPDFWQVSYASSRIVFYADAIRRFDAGEQFDIDDYL